MQRVHGATRLDGVRAEQWIVSRREILRRAWRIFEALQTNCDERFYKGVGNYEPKVMGGESVPLAIRWTDLCLRYAHMYRQDPKIVEMMLLLAAQRNEKCLIYIYTLLDGHTDSHRFKLRGVNSKTRRQLRIWLAESLRAVLLNPSGGKGRF